MKNLTRFLFIIILLHLLIVFFSHRSVFTTPYDRDYWKERYEQSQWMLPLSKRIIGDDGLYLYTGDQLIHGANPISFSAEVPPFAKYLIGFFILLFNNGNLYGLAINTFILIVFFFLTNTLLKNKTLSLTATALLALDPLFTNQFFRTMVDNTQLLLLLVFFLLLAKISSDKRKNPVFLAIFLGIVLGFFSATKLPLFSPFLALFGIILFFKRRKYLPIFIFLFAALFAYLLTYFRYFTLGYNLLDWLKMQKWVISFYRQSLLVPNKGSALTALLFNQYQNLFSKTRETIDFWSLSWPLIAVLGTIGLFSRINKNRKPINLFLWVTIAIFFLGVFLIINLIPFWPRYLLLLLPFLYLGFTTFVFSLKKTRIGLILILLLLSFNWLTSVRLLFPTPEKSVEQLLYDWRHGFFSDMYQQITEKSRQGQSRKEFHQFGQKVFYDAEIEATDTEIINPRWSRWQSPQVIKIKITYFTRNLGSFTEEKSITVVKEKDLWRIPWQWDSLINDLNDQSVLETRVIEAKRGAIIAPNKKKLAQDIPNYLIWITSSKVEPDREQEMLKFLEDLSGKQIAAAAFHHRYASKNQPHKLISIGIPPKQLSPQEKQKLKEYSGITLTPKLGRAYQYESIYPVGKIANTHYFECCSLLYSTTTYDGISGIEKEKNEILKGHNGGSLVIKDQKGKIIRKIIEREKKDGQDIQL